MTEVLLANRKAAVLAPSQLACLSKLPTVNLTAGCAHECVYCYARNYSQNPGRGRITLYANTLEKLQWELPRKRKRPRVVYFSPSCDAFQPVPEVLELAYDVFEFLLERGIGVAFLSKGRIPERHMALLKAHASNIHAGIGLTTLNERVWEAFEPRTAAPDVRLAQIDGLVQAGIDTQVRLDPILPGVTDDEQTLSELFALLGPLGVGDVAISTAFTRPAIVRAVRRYVRERDWAEAFLGHYSSGVEMIMQGAGTSVVMPPAATRRAIYGRVARVAARYGVPVRVCACKNADLAVGSCHIAGDWSDRPHGAKQRLLFE